MARNVVTQVDSADFFVQAQDNANFLIAVSATAGSTNITGIFANRLHRGVAVFAAVTSLTVNTATLAVNIIAINPADLGNYVVARASLDGIAANGNYGIEIYPGMPAAGGGPSQGANFAQAGGVLPANFAIQTSLTVSTTASMSGTIGYKINMSRVL